MALEKSGKTGYEKNLATILLLLTLQTIIAKRDNNGLLLKNRLDSNCLKCACMGTGLDESYRKTITDMNSLKQYLVLASETTYIDNHMLVTGTHPRTMKDVDKLCFTNLYNMQTGASIMQSQDVNFTSTIIFKKLSEISEYNLAQIFDPAEMSVGQAKYYTVATSAKRYKVVWTDGISVQLYTSCRFDGQTIWEVWSTKKALSKNLRKQIMKQVKSLGFDPSAAYATSYKKCM